ncbi:DUF222 domain-containing protein [Herbiconiux sp. 11R-BC]|uniref:HNH endonuclease signature motif containing protein n=1 Tax=Herbiconiux sp. 11R-BC TaxID=3111637 RepID=UPI003BFEEF62
MKEVLLTPRPGENSPGHDSPVDHSDGSDGSDGSSLGLLGTGRRGPGLRAALRSRADSPLDELVSLERAVGELHALRAEVLAELSAWAELSSDATAPAGLGAARRDLARRSLVAEVACAMHLSESTAGRLLVDGEVLARELPATLAALRSGAITYVHAQAVARHAHALPESVRPAYDAAVMATASGQTPSQLDTRARRLRERLHPESLEARHSRAAADRFVAFQADRDGMAWLTAFLPAVEAIAIDDALDQIARGLRADDEPRSHAQLRADAFTGLVLGPGGGFGVPTHPLANPGPTDSFGRPVAPNASASPSHAETDTGTATDTGTGTAGGQLPAASRHGALAGDDESTDAGRADVAHQLGRVRPTVIVTVPVMTLLGHSDAPGELHGYGPIDAATATRIAAHAPSFIRMLTHPDTGQTLSVGRERYQPPADLRLALRLADEHCRFPGCSRRASRCELDHCEAWQAGGHTSASNLFHLCSRHHHLKHESNWSPTAGSGRHLTWRSPTGRHYETSPAPSPVPPVPPACAVTPEDDTPKEDAPPF